MKQSPPTSPLTEAPFDWKRWSINAGVLALTVVGGWYAWRGIQHVLETDSLEGYRAESNPFQHKEGVIMPSQEMRVYRGERLVATFQIGEVVVTDDRSQVKGRNISDGRIFSEDGQAYVFTAGEATYGQYSKALIAEQGVRIVTEGIDLQAQGFNYDHNKQTVTVTGNVQGKVSDGDLVAQSVVFDLKNDVLTTGEAKWAGMITMPGTQQQRRWEVQAATTKRQTGGVMVFTQAVGQDADTLVSCDNMEYNNSTDIVKASGNVKYFGKEANMACDRATIYRKERRSILEADKRVTMLIKAEESAPKQTTIPVFEPEVPADLAANRPRDQGGQEPPVRRTDNLRDYPIAVDAGKIEYWYAEGSRRATITGSPYARQTLPDGEWRDLACHNAKYDGQGEKLSLFSAKEGDYGVKIKDSLGDDLEAGQAIVSTAEGDDAYEAWPIRGSVVPTDDLPTTGGGGGTTGSGLRGPVGNGRR